MSLINVGAILVPKRVDILWFLWQALCGSHLNNFWEALMWAKESRCWRCCRGWTRKAPSRFWCCGGQQTTVYFPPFLLLVRDMSKFQKCQESLTRSQEDRYSCARKVIALKVPGIKCGESVGWKGCVPPSSLQILEWIWSYSDVNLLTWFNLLRAYK